MTTPFRARDLLFVLAGLAVMAGALGTWGSGDHTERPPMSDATTEHRTIRGADMSDGFVLAAPGALLAMAPFLRPARRTRAIIAGAAAGAAGLLTISVFASGGQSIVWMHFEIFGRWDTWSYGWGLPLAAVGALAGLVFAVVEVNADDEIEAPLPA